MKKIGNIGGYFKTSVFEIIRIILVGFFSFSGHIAERMNLRHFLVVGMISSGIMTAAFGFGYFFKIHVLWFYILVQVSFL